MATDSNLKWMSEQRVQIDIIKLLDTICFITLCTVAKILSPRLHGGIKSTLCRSQLYPPVQGLCILDTVCARNYRPSFRENKLKTLVVND
jgi:hypothetical protein